MTRLEHLKARLSMKRVLLPALFLLALCYPLHPALGYVTAALLIAVCALCELPAALYAYVFLFWMDEVMPFAPLGGSIVRVMQLALGVRLAVTVVRCRLWVRLSDVALAAFTVAACAVGLAVHGVTVEMLSFGLNVGLFVLMRVALRARADAPWVARGMLRTYVYGAVAAVAVGFAQQRFVTLLLGEFTQSYARFMGTFEPNFMAVFLGAAILIWMALDWERPWQDLLVLGVLGGALLSTFSMTGMLCFFLASLFMLVRMRRGLRRTLVRVARAAPVALAVFAAFSAFVSLRGVESFTRGLISEDMHDYVYYIEEEDYVYARDHGIDFMEVSRRASDTITEEERQASVDQHMDALEHSVQQSALLVRLQEALERVTSGDWDKLTSGRYGLFRMKLSDFGALPLWQKLVGTGPDAQLTYQPNARQRNYAHNSWLDALYSFGFIGFALLVCWIVRSMRGNLFAGIRLTGSTALAVQLARVALMLGGLTLSMHINRTFLFFFFMG